MNKIICGDCLEVMKSMPDNSVDSIVSDPPYGIAFMGKKWDYDIPSVEIWYECLRVLKPGGHALIACGTRTQHRMAVNLEDAGFEIRDLIAWVYGQGFPKSYNIAQSIEKLQTIGKSRRPDRELGLSRDRFSGSVENTLIANTGGQVELTTDDAKKFEGWGTALKPAMELWTLCRKPLSENTIAENVLKWGTGGINIDGCRIGISENDDPRLGGNGGWSKKKTNEYIYGKYKGCFVKSNSRGRFPANFIHDGSDETMLLFPECASGKLTGKFPKENKNGIFGRYNAIDVDIDTNSGSAARFFYCAKASKTERNIGLDELEPKHASHDGRDKHIENPYQRHDNIQRNFHPTVKPISLMTYLCRLITPAGGVILDPFMGSGTTCVAAKLEEFNYIGIEKHPGYCEIAEKRIAAVGE